MNNANFSRKKEAPELITIGGVTPFTTIDFPGELAAVVFMQGCPWRCDYCHNKALISRRESGQISWQATLDFLRRRRILIDGVVFSGGEPTLQSGLLEAIRQVKRLGFKIGLHTAGVYPDRLKRILPWLDWVGLDIKASKSDYSDITGVANSGTRAWESARLLVNSNVDYEVRTTLHPILMDRANLDYLIDELKRINVTNFCMQQCNLNFCSDITISGTETFSLSQNDLEKIGSNFSKFEFRPLA